MEKGFFCNMLLLTCSCFPEPGFLLEQQWRSAFPCCIFGGWWEVGLYINLKIKNTNSISLILGLTRSLLGG